MKEIQISREIFLKSMDTMKKTLDLIEFKFDKRTKEFKYFKSQIMNSTYDNLRKLFKFLEDNKIIEKCPHNHNLRQGFKNCSCGGSGYINFRDKK